jgi:hypothetical protein
LGYCRFYGLRSEIQCRGKEEEKMRFFFAVLLALAGPALVAAQISDFHLITKPGQGESVPAGSKYDILWQPSATYPGAITIDLLGGASTANLRLIVTIASKISTSSNICIKSKVC